MISREHALRLCRAVIFDEFSRSAPEQARRMPALLWPEDMRLDEDGLGFDSLSLIELVTAMNQRFALQRTGVEDYMLIQPVLGTWADLLVAHFQMAPPDLEIGFRTSGSTGAAKSIHHRLDALTDEIAQHIEASLPRNITRILSLVPAHHIYGFLFTVLLPSCLDLPLQCLAGKGPGALSRSLLDGDLVIGTPHLLSHTLPYLAGQPVAAHAISSGAPAPAALWEEVKRAGLTGLTEIYGASETGGIGYRHAAEAPFRLLPGLEPGNPPTRNGIPINLQDRLHWEEGGFRVAGRCDNAIQVGGQNVFPAQVARALEIHPHVRAAAVRPGRERLKAFIVPHEDADTAELESRLRTHLAASLPPAARPFDYTFGPALPRNGMGKLADWPEKEGPERALPGSDHATGNRPRKTDRASPAA